MGKTTNYFTRAAVQRAMDRRAERWGAPRGYYTVEERTVRARGTGAQVWHVSVRLFGGRKRHTTPVMFKMGAGGPEYLGPINEDSTDHPAVTGTNRKA